MCLTERERPGREARLSIFSETKGIRATLFFRRHNSDEAQSDELDYKFSELYAELYSVKDELEEMQSGASALDGDMLNEMREVVTGLKNHPVEYDDKAVRQLIDCIKVMSADMIKICFKDGTVTEVLM